ncbi:hypothetical protein [Mucilaginibacter mallensis]|uniref:hypothetical protein n=1 Tax=Mucilaginibacter mallensis TaxID=652787 RepID=UPI000B8173E9|nr:hypothetical protein [Mucilaginibacter mallensis]
MKTQINHQFIIRGDYDSLPDNIIGVAVSLLNDDINHSGIFIRYNNTNYLFHFDSVDVVLIEIPKDAIVFFKQLTFIPPEFITSTFHWFRQLEKFKSPDYGLFYSGSFYNESTLEFIDKNQMPEIMSCVGFCLNVLKTVLRGNDFINYTDWNYHNGITDDKILRYFINAKKNYPDIDIIEFAQHVRRILPVEYFTAGFDLNIPVKKAFTDSNNKEVTKIIMEKVSSF